MHSNKTLILLIDSQVQLYSVPRLGFGLGRIWVSRVSLPLSFYYSCVYLQYIVIVIVISLNVHNFAESSFECRALDEGAVNSLK